MQPVKNATATKGLQGKGLGKDNARVKKVKSEKKTKVNSSLNNCTLLARTMDDADAVAVAASLWHVAASVIKVASVRANCVCCQGCERMCSTA